VVAEPRKAFDQDVKEGVVRLVWETGWPIAQVARDLGINRGTLWNWVGEDERTELARLRRANAALAMERVL
jgi:transposase